MVQLVKFTHYAQLGIMHSTHFKFVESVHVSTN